MLEVCQRYQTSDWRPGFGAWLSASPFVLWLPQLDCGPGGKNNEINNTGTVRRGTQPCPFLSPLPHTTACVKKKTPSSLCCAWFTMPICPSASSQQASNPPRVPTLFLVSFHVFHTLAHTHTCRHTVWSHVHTHSYSMRMWFLTTFSLSNYFE